MTAADYMAAADVDADLERLSTHNHPNATAIQEVGGWRIKCLNCKIEGKRLYQDRGVAMSISFRLALDPSKPTCQHVVVTKPKTA